MIEPTKIKEIIRRYYELVDNNKIKDLLKLFSNDIYYRRCKNEIRGMKEFKDFYNNFYNKERSISGKHKVIRVIIQNRIAVVEGTFEGKWNDGVPLTISFSDIHFFNDEGKIHERHTYTDQGKV